MPEQPFQIYDILYHDRLCHILIGSSLPEEVEQLFVLLEQQDIDIKFFTGMDGGEQLQQVSFCVEQSFAKAVQALAVKCGIRDNDVVISDRTGMVAIYGPHFSERPGVIHAMHSALVSKGIDVRCISTTVSTSYMLIPEGDVAQAVDIIGTTFEIPHGKI